MKGVLSRQDARFDLSCPALMAPMCRVLRLRVSDLGLVSDYCFSWFRQITPMQERTKDLELGARWEVLATSGGQAQTRAILRKRS